MKERFILFKENGILKLKDTERPKYKPIYVDFSEYLEHWNRQKSALKKTLLAKAIGFKGEPLKILDATLGLARDAFYFCLLGAEVTAAERSPILFSLIDDAVRRGEEIPHLKKLKIQNCDAKEIRGRFDVIYLDPMYPDIKSSAAPQAEMQILRDLLPVESNLGNLFEFALKNANARVVVKRPPRAPPLAGKLIHSYVGKAVRYDAYRPQSGLGS